MASEVGTMRKEAVVVVIEQDERLLIIKRAPATDCGGYWAPLSGRIDRGEDQAAAVVRETLEEVGLHVQPIRKVWECPTHDGKIWLHWWLAQIIGGDLVIEPAEVSEARWMTVPEFLALEKTFEDDRYFFTHVFANSTLPDPKGRMG